MRSADHPAVSSLATSGSRLQPAAINMHIASNAAVRKRPDNMEFSAGIVGIDRDRASWER
jgi:hypothetical protein